MSDNHSKTNTNVALVVADVRVLVYLASVGLLDSLVENRCSVILPDIVIYKAVEDLRWPFAPDIAAWLESVTASYVQDPAWVTGRQQEPHKVQIMRSDFGAMYAVARLAAPLQTSGSAGFRALESWLFDYIAAFSGELLLLGESDTLHKIAELTSTAAQYRCLTTLDFLRDCERRGRLQGADKIWENILWHRQKRNLDADLEQR